METEYYYTVHAVRTCNTHAPEAFDYPGGDPCTLRRVEHVGLKREHLTEDEHFVIFVADEYAEKADMNAPEKYPTREKALAALGAWTVGYGSANSFRYKNFRIARNPK